MHIPEVARCLKERDGWQSSNCPAAVIILRGSWQRCRTGVGERWSHMTFGTPHHEVVLEDLVSFEIFGKIFAYHLATVLSMSIGSSCH